MDVTGPDDLCSLVVYLGTSECCAQCHAAEYNEYQRGDAVHDLPRQAVRKTVAQIDDWHVGKHHAQRRATDHAEEVVESGGESDRDDLSFVTHLS